MGNFYCIYLFLSKGDDIIRMVNNPQTLKKSLIEEIFWRKIMVKHEREREKGDYRNSEIGNLGKEHWFVKNNATNS